MSPFRISFCSLRDTLLQNSSLRFRTSSLSVSHRKSPGIAWGVNLGNESDSFWYSSSATRFLFLD
jgi:hypothetical protein